MSRTARENTIVSKSSASKSASAKSTSGKPSVTKAAGTPAATALPARKQPNNSTAGGKKGAASSALMTTKRPSLAEAAAAAMPRTRSRVASAAIPAIEVQPQVAAKPAAKTPAKPRAAKPAPAPRTVAKATAAYAAATRAAKAPPKPLPLAERPIDQVWRQYRAEPTEEIRNFLIARHLDLVAYAAERLHKRLPSEVEVNDLKSAGAFGLMDAVESFDPDRGVKFETFCTQRIRGAMFDELRSMDWVPRLVRSRTAKVEKVRKSIEMETGARPTEDEVATRLNVSGDEFEKLQKDSRPISMVSLTRKCFETDSSKDVREIDVVEDGRQENPLQAVQKQDLQALITKGLSRAERLIVILYYYEEMTMKEIGATLDLSESRVSQMHSSILARLKAQMQHRETVEE